MISLFLLSLLLGLVFWIYSMGASAWRKAEAQAELQSEVQKILSNLTREVERSTFASVSQDLGTAVGMLSAMTDQQVVALNSSASTPMWQRYVVYYFDAASGEVRLVIIPLAPTAPERVQAAPLLPLSTYRVGGRALGRGIKSCLFTLTPGLIQINLTGERYRYGNRNPDTVEVQLASTFRN